MISKIWYVENSINKAIHFIFSKGNDEEYVIHSKFDNMEIMINGKADEVTEKCFQSFLSRYQNKLKTSIRSGDFIFGCVNLLY